MDPYCNLTFHPLSVPPRHHVHAHTSTSVHEHLLMLGSVLQHWYFYCSKGSEYFFTSVKVQKYHQLS